MLSVHSERIFSYLREGRSIKELINLGEELLGSPLLFADPDHVHREVSASYPLEDLKERFRYLYQASPEDIATYVTEPFSRATGNAPFIVHTPTFSRRHMICKACWSSRYVGYLLLPEGATPLEELDGALISHLADACAIAGVLELGATLIESNRPSAYILNDLIAGRISTPEALESRLLGSSLCRFADYFLVSVLCGDRGRDRRFLNAAALRLHNSIDRCRVFFDDEGLFFLMEGEGLSEAQRKKLEELRKKFGFVFGVSDGFSDLWDLAEGHRQAEYAAALARNGAWLIHYDDCKILDALAHAPRRLWPSFVSNAYKQMKEYDEKNGTDYVYTVSIFLKNDANMSSASKAMFVHKNTLLYRFKRMKELFGLDLERFHDLVKFYISYCLDSGLIPELPQS